MFFPCFFWEINYTPFNSIWLPTLPTFLPVSFPSCRSDWLPAAESGVQGRKWKWKLCSFAKDNHRPLEIYETWKFLGNSKLRPKISFKNHPVLLCITWIGSNWLVVSYRFFWIFAQRIGVAWSNFQQTRKHPWLFRVFGCSDYDTIMRIPIKQPVKWKVRGSFRGSSGKFSYTPLKFNKEPAKIRPLKKRRFCLETIILRLHVEGGGGPFKLHGAFWCQEHRQETETKKKKQCKC